MTFIQTIEFTTSRIDDVEALMDEWVEATDGARRAQHSVLTADRDRSNTYVQIVEFPSYDEAMNNSNLAQTSELSGKMAALCEGPPIFRNLDTRRVDELA
jgi:hypothetical protein